MQKKQIFWLVLGINVLITVISFVISAVSPIFTVIGSAFLTICLGMLTYFSFKKYKHKKYKTVRSIDDMLLMDANDNQEQEIVKEKQSFYEKTESFSNSIIPYALAVITICALGLFIALISN